MSRAIIMSKKEFRPRPIDINQPIPIISDEKILEEIERENYSIASPIKPRLKTPKNKLSAVDTPLYRELSEKSSIRFARPQNYIIYNEEDSDGALSAGEQEYELDHADELFLAALNVSIKQRGGSHPNHSNHSIHSNHNHSNHSTPSPRESSRQLRTRSTPPTPVKGRKDKGVIPVCLAVTDDMLEQLIDGLEKEAFFSYGLRQMKDNTMDGILCCVCNDHQGDAADPLILCDGCNMATHQHCYGISEVPVATWLCARCVNRESNSMCVLCGGRYGGMKATADGHWVHVLCALWFPEVSCKDSFLRDPISGIDKIHSDRWHKVCSLCNDTRGVCITCDEPGCKTQFHVGCARAQGSYLEARPDNQNENNVVLKAYCSLHSLHHLEHYPVFPRDVERSLGNETALVAKSMGLSEEDYNIIYSYWRVKRRSHPPPLLKRLRSSDLRVRPASQLHQQLTPSEALARFVRLRQDFERARMLVDLVRKRELAKRQLLDSIHSLVRYHTGGGEEDDDEEEQEEPEEPSKEKRENHTPKRVRR